MVSNFYTHPCRASMPIYDTSFEAATVGKPKGVSEGEGNMRSLLPKTSFYTLKIIVYKVAVGKLVSFRGIGLEVRQLNAISIA